MKHLFYTAAAVSLILFAACSDKKPVSAPDTSENYIIAGSEITDSTATDTTAVADSIGAGELRQSITQYLLVQVVDSGVTLRTPDDIAERLRPLGFVVRQYSESAADEQDIHISLRAERREGVEATTVSYSEGENSMITVDCAEFDEVDDFITSMKKSGYKAEKNIYSHEKNGKSKVFILVTGKTIKIISPTGDLPHYF